MARGEDAELGEVLEAAAAASLREMSHHPELVGLLLRRWVGEARRRAVQRAAHPALSLGGYPVKTSQGEQFDYAR